MQRELKISLKHLPMHVLRSPVRALWPTQRAQDRETKLKGLKAQQLSTREADIAVAMFTEQKLLRALPTGWLHRSQRTQTHRGRSA